MNTLKRIYHSVNQQLDVRPDDLHNNCNRYVKHISDNTSTKSIRGATTNLTTCYDSDNISWRRLLTYFRIIQGTYITITVVCENLTLISSDFIHYPVNGVRIHTATHYDGIILLSLTNMLVSEIELERLIKADVMEKCDIDNEQISSRVTNLYTALTHKKLSWTMFVYKLRVLGIRKASLTIDVTLQNKSVIVTSDISELR